MYHIERALKYLRSMVGNKARVEGCIVESFLLMEITYFSSVYFGEEHNVNALILRYNVKEEPPLSDLKKFQWRGTTATSSTTYYCTQEERKSALLYMYSNMEEMDLFSCKYPLYFLPPYSSTSRYYSFICLCSEFDKHNWRSNRQPTSKQLVVM
jgi:hypothetical protein